MVGYEQAREIALSGMSDKAWFDFCTEDERAWVFSRYEDTSFGGTGPCAVLKDTGEACDYAAVLGETGETLRAFRMDADGALHEMPLAEYMGE